MEKTIKEWQKEIHRLAREKGWYEEERNVGEVIALIHSELSEALEEYRIENDNLNQCYYLPTDYKKPEGFPIELADAVIRILDFCEFAGIDLEFFINIKHEYNKTREYRHGGKKA